VETLGAYLERFDHLSALDTRYFALKGAEEATAAPKAYNDVETSVFVGQTQSTAMDLLRASGMDYTESRQVLREAARRAYEEEPTAND